jgi:hypothetical protein
VRLPAAKACLLCVLLSVVTHPSRVGEETARPNSRKTPVVLGPPDSPTSVERANQLARPVCMSCIHFILYTTNVCIHSTDVPIAWRIFCSTGEQSCAASTDKTAQTSARQPTVRTSNTSTSASITTKCNYDDERREHTAGGNLSCVCVACFLLYLPYYTYISANGSI